MKADIEAVADATQLAPEDYVHYRAVSTLAVASLVLGVMAALVFLDWTLAAIGLIGIVVGILAIVKINRNPLELTGRKFAAIGIALCLLFVAGGWSWHAFVYMTEVPEWADRISYDDLTPAEGAPPSQPPESALALDGKKVFIKGYMYPGSRKNGIEQFVLCRDNGDCCFGGQPKLTDMIQVRLKAPMTTDYTTRIRSVAGVLHVEPSLAADDRGVVLYHMDVEHLK